MPTEDKYTKDLRIKVGVLKRTLKEKISYQQELDELGKKIEQYKSEGKDPHFIKNQEEILKETAMMIPDAVKRLTTAFKNLKELTTAENSEVPEIYQTAQTLLEEASPHILPDAE